MVSPEPPINELTAAEHYAAREVLHALEQQFAPDAVFGFQFRDDFRAQAAAHLFTIGENPGPSGDSQHLPVVDEGLELPALALLWRFRRSGFIECLSVDALVGRSRNVGDSFLRFLIAGHRPGVAASAVGAQGFFFFANADHDGDGNSNAA